MWGILNKDWPRLRRLVGLLIDGTVVLCIWSFIVILNYYFPTTIRSSKSYVLILPVYFIISEVFTKGYTLGKYVTGIRIEVTYDGYNRLTLLLRGALIWMLFSPSMFSPKLYSDTITGVRSQFSQIGKHISFFGVLIETYIALELSLALVVIVSLFYPGSKTVADLFAGTYVSRFSSRSYKSSFISQCKLFLSTFAISLLVTTLASHYYRTVMNRRVNELATVNEELMYQSWPSMNIPLFQRFETYYTEQNKVRFLGRTAVIEMNSSRQSMKNASLHTVAARNACEVICKRFPSTEYIRFDLYDSFKAGWVGAKYTSRVYMDVQENILFFGPRVEWISDKPKNRILTLSDWNYENTHYIIDRGLMGGDTLDVKLRQEPMIGARIMISTTF